jgi:hypothetical protein
MGDQAKEVAQQAAGHRSATHELAGQTAPMVLLDDV